MTQDTTRDPGAKRISGTCHDVATDTTGAVAWTQEAHVDASVTFDRRLLALATDPPIAPGLFGDVAVAHGFRALLATTLPDDDVAGSPRFALLDDLPVAALIAGYADLYADRPRLREHATELALKADICAGWRSDGTMIPAFRATGRIPIPIGPPAPAPDPSADPWGWHPMAPLPASAMRRRRLLDVGDRLGSHGGERNVQATFRDTHTDDTGTETVLHEYSLTAVVDAATSVVLTCEATPHVLPWDECPAAAASAGWLVGRSLGEIRTVVARELRGTGICTHLNDLLRSLAYVAVLDGLRPTRMG